MSKVNTYIWDGFIQDVVKVDLPSEPEVDDSFMESFGFTKTVKEHDS